MLKYGCGVTLFAQTRRFAVERFNAMKQDFSLLLTVGKLSIHQARYPLCIIALLIAKIISWIALEITTNIDVTSTRSSQSYKQLTF